MPELVVSLAVIPPTWCCLRQILDDNVTQRHLGEMTWMVEAALLSQICLILLTSPTENVLL